MFTQEQIDYFLSKIKEINALSTGDTLDDESKQVELAKLVEQCFTTIVNKKEKEALSNPDIFEGLAQCKYSEHLYKPIGTSWALTDYWAKIVQTAKKAKAHRSKFYLHEDVLYLLRGDLTFPDCVVQSDTLLVGEKNFCFAHSYKITHSQIKLIASEYELYDKHGNLKIDFNDAITYLLDNGVIIAYGMDATKLHTYELLNNKGPHFKRIQFNCPYDARDRTVAGSLEKKHTKKLVADFMSSAKPLLHAEGRLHVAIQQPKGSVPRRWGKEEYQEAYHLQKSALTYQFELVKVMGDIQDRYSRKVSKVIAETPAAAPAEYVPYLGIGETHRVNQFIFGHQKSWLDYSTDNETDSEKDIKQPGLS